MRSSKVLPLLFLLLVCVLCLCACGETKDSIVPGDEEKDIPPFVTPEPGPDVNITGDWELSLSEYDRLLGNSAIAGFDGTVIYSFYEDGKYCMQVTPDMGKQPAYGDYTVSGGYLTIRCPGEDLGPFRCTAQNGCLYLSPTDGGKDVVLQPAR